jgi:hypothetical protein
VGIAVPSERNARTARRFQLVVSAVVVRHSGVVLYTGGLLLVLVVGAVLNRQTRPVLGWLGLALMVLGPLLVGFAFVVSGGAAFGLFCLGGLVFGLRFVFGLIFSIGMARDPEPTSVSLPWTRYSDGTSRG